jgi:hypothetical protein
LLRWPARLSAARSWSEGEPWPRASRSASLGVALLSTIALSRSEEVLASHPRLAPAAALTQGFGDALLAGAAFAAVGALLASVLIRRRVATAAAAADRTQAETPALERAA